MDNVNKYIHLKNINIIENPKGSIYHALKFSDEEFNGFGEAYFTTINFNETKGWKFHKKMIMNLIVPFGNVRFNFIHEGSSTCEAIIIGEDNYKRLTVYPGVWMSFTGLNETKNIILNISNIEHNSSEAINLPLDHFKLKNYK